jgi:hypothetical protein
VKSLLNPKSSLTYFTNIFLTQVGSWCGVRSDAGWSLANGGLALQRVQRPLASGPSMGDMTLQPVGPEGSSVSFAAEDDPGMIRVHGSCLKQTLVCTWYICTVGTRTGMHLVECALCTDDTYSGLADALARPWGVYTCYS